MFTSCEREDISGGNESQTGLKLPTGPPVIVNFTVEEKEKEASPSPSEGGEMEKTATRSAVTPSSAAFVMPPKDEDSSDFAKALYFSPASGVLNGTLEGSQGDDFHISANMQENAPSVTLRAIPLDPDIKVRVLAYSIETSYDTLYCYADYEVDAGHNLIPYGTAPMTVPSGGDVRFVAYSFNADTLPPHAATISNIGSYDLIYVADTVYVVSSNMTVHLVLEHLFSKINLVVDAQLNPGNLIDDIWNARYNHTFPTLSVHTGDLTPSGVSGQTIPFEWTSTSQGNPWNSKDHFAYLPPPAPPSIVVTIDSVEIDATKYKRNPPPWTIDYNTPLEPGKAYTLNVFFTKCVPGELEIDRTVLIFPYNGGNESVTVTTDQPGWTIESVTNDNNGGTTGPSNWLTTSNVSPSSGNSGGTITVSFANTYTLSPNVDPYPRIAVITVKAGTSCPTTKEIVVVQLPQDLLYGRGVTGYVGAYWRWNQTGERVMYFRDIATNGVSTPWAASVTWYDSNWNPAGGNGIVFASGNSNDPAIHTINPGNAENYQITNGSMSVNGVTTNGQIIFRMGLQQTFTGYNETTNPARYAKVALVYGTAPYEKIQVLFIRQGEGADYMSQDPYYTNLPKWSPYNIGNYVGPNSASNLVDFPTKAGFFYQWGYSTTVSTPVAYSPVDPVSPTWVAGTTTPATLYALGTVCPAGYTVPTGFPSSQGGGDAAARIPTSQFATLVAREPVGGLYNGPWSNDVKAIWGNYADGYFDRKQTQFTEYYDWNVISPSNYANLRTYKTVPTTDQIAYSGLLFYNTNTNASIFFPSGGSRKQDNLSNGVLTLEGIQGIFWGKDQSGPSSLYPYGYGGSGLIINPGNRRTSILSGENYFAGNGSTNALFMGSDNPFKNNGYLVRCVYDPTGPCAAVTSVNISSSLGLTVNSGASTTLTASITPSGITDASYLWESYNAAIDQWVTIGTDDPVVITPIMTIGENKFRVTITNACSPQTSNITITRTNPPAPVGGSAARITWEPISPTYPSGRYTVTFDPRDAGLFFQFGSVIGLFSGDGGVNQVLIPSLQESALSFSFEDVAWAPDENLMITTSLTMNQIPHAQSSDGTIIDASFHTAANVKAGMGDPCRLIGLDLDYIQKTMTAGETDRSKYDNGTWRMPTYEDNWNFTEIPSAQTGYLYWWDPGENPMFEGVPGGEFPERNLGGVFKFLPAAGYRADDSEAGAIKDQMSVGRYWSSEGDIFETGFDLMFEYGWVNPGESFSRQFALPIRCVYDPTTLTVSSTTWSPDANPQTSSSFTVTTNQAIWNAASDASSWCTVSPTTGSTGGNFTITVAANSGAARTAHITVTAGSALPVTVTVTQAACVPLTNISTSVSPSGTQPVGTTVTITASITPSTATNVVYTWELNSGTGWNPVMGATGNVLVVTAIPISTQYRVTAANGCSTQGPTTPITVTGSGYPTDDKGDLPGGNLLSYVGAFWRATETGERVIRINMGDNPALHMGNWGPWSAQLSEWDGRWDPDNGDGIMFAAGGSPDPNIYQASPGNAESYTLSSLPAGSYSTMVTGSVDPQYTGNSYIEFRIFPQKSFSSTGKFRADQANPANDANYTTTWPARYAVVYLTYGQTSGGAARTQKIFLRQGEGSDYVMYDQGFTITVPVGYTDTNPGYTHSDGTKRPLVNRFSPYNLTDPLGNTQTDYNNMVDASTGLLPVRGGALIDFPTKAGYLFMFNYSTRAFNPFTPIINNYFYSNSGSNIIYPLWNAATNETCPTGYRRPTDFDTGTANGSSILQSEIRQSLFLRPPAGMSNQPTAENSITWGYYADGYFDRREIVTPSNSPAVTTPSVVADNSIGIAYAGMLIYSSRTLAHLFFPTGGIRQSQVSTSDPASNGLLYRQVTYGYYQTSTPVAGAGNSQERHLFLDTRVGYSGDPQGGILGGARLQSNFVRCVRE